jgi:hypothetical protein
MCCRESSNNGADYCANNHGDGINDDARNSYTPVTATECPAGSTTSPRWTPWLPVGTCSTASTCRAAFAASGAVTGCCSLRPWHQGGSRRQQAQRDRSARAPRPGSARTRPATPHRRTATRQATAHAGGPGPVSRVDPVVAQEGTCPAAGGPGPRWYATGAGPGTGPAPPPAAAWVPRPPPVHRSGATSPGRASRLSVMTRHRTSAGSATGRPRRRPPTERSSRYKPNPAS